MYYRYFWPITYLLNIFGVTKPLKSRAISLLFKIWSLLVAAGFVMAYFISIPLEFSLNLEQLWDFNDLVMIILIICLNFIRTGKTCKILYEELDILIKDLKICTRIIKLLALKLHLWICIPIGTFLIVIVLEILYGNSFSLLIRVPMFLSMMHLYVHLCLQLAALKVLNCKLSNVLICYDETSSWKSDSKANVIVYILYPSINMISLNENEHIDLKVLCKVYDHLSTCLQLLENHHGFQMLLSIWLLFSSAVIGMTLVVCKQAQIVWLVVAKSVLPFIWTFIGCHIDDQIELEVDRTSTILVKYLIDYRCDPPRKLLLETFKQLVSTNRLQFSSFGLFRLNYSMLYSTVLNVITYGIIVIQLFLSQ